MNSLVIVGSRSGNTRTIAEAIADGLRAAGPVQITELEEAPTVVPTGTTLLVIGAPTEGHGLYEPMEKYLERLSDEGLAGMEAAAFDTRLDWPRWLSGSAADRIADALRDRGASVLSTESFLVTMKPELEDGQLERARAWGSSLADAVAAAAAAG
ncbi:MAG TPA: flavodoxin family protein [Candidatus Limnocylindria bacterium]|nr:flavodoxin family protein [Candidatus Limnocylindria bacterium]